MKSQQMKFNLDKLIENRKGLSEEERSTLKKRITAHVRRKANKPIKLYLSRKKGVRLVLTYMYGGMFQVVLQTKETAFPLNTYDEIDKVIDIISKQKSRV